MRRGSLFIAAAGLLLASCQHTVVVPANDRDTGGGGISRHEGRGSTVEEGRAVGTGLSASGQGQGMVPGSGAPPQPGNAYSASDSNGGRPVHLQQPATPAGSAQPPASTQTPRGGPAAH